MEKLYLRNGLLVDPSQHLSRPLDLLLADGRIEAVGDRLFAEDAQVIDCTGYVVTPGLIDMHVHLRDPGQTHKEDILTGCAAAAAGGITAVAAMPNTTPPVDSAETLDYILRKAAKAKAVVYPVATITQGMRGDALSDLRALRDAGAAAVSDDGRPVENARLLQEAMLLADELGLPVISHCEDLNIIDGGIIHEGTVSHALGVKGMHRSSEDSITAREIAIAAATGTAIHIAHVSTAGSVALIRDAKARGVRVTCETAPHYFTLTHEALRGRDADYRMNPPLREESDRLAIIEGIKDGTIDCIVTDHAPHAAAEKADFLKAPNGIVGLETSLAASITGLVEPGHISLERLVELMCLNPAKILRLFGGKKGEAGCLQPGYPANVTVFDPKRRWTVEPGRLHSKSHNTAFKGMALTGKAVCTIVRGKIVYEDFA